MIKWMDRFNNLFFDLLGKVEVQTQLKMQPKIRRIPEELCQAQSSAGCDTPASIHQIIDTLVWNMDGSSPVPAG